MNKEQEKKTKEKRIIATFLKSNSLDFELLELAEAQSIFPIYTGENPDVIVFNGKEYVGIELFTLSLKKSRKVNPEFKNFHHRQNQFPQKINNHNLGAHTDALHRYGLASHDNLEEILLERISEKIDLLSRYCTEKVWFIGHATEIAHQTGLVEEIMEDGIEENLKKSFLSKISIPPRVEKIILFETGTSEKSYTFYLKDSTCYSFV